MICDTCKFGKFNCCVREEVILAGGNSCRLFTLQKVGEKDPEFQGGSWSIVKLGGVLETHQILPMPENAENSLDSVTKI